MESASVFVARQPILDKKLETFGYELLFRAGVQNVFAPGCDGDHASLSVMNAGFLGGELLDIAGGKVAFVNFTRKLLVEGYAELLPPESVVVEVLETVEPDAEVTEACRRLHEKGYRIALDDFSYSPAHEPLLAYADIVKVDFLLSAPKERAATAERLLPRGIGLLAEKVENGEEVEEARGLGFSYYQGYFFSKPHILSARRAGQSRTSRLQLLQEVNHPDFDIEAAEAIIGRDPLLAMRLLKYINSAGVGVRHEVKSIRHALNLLGQRNLRKWVLVLTLSGMGEDKPGELLRQALVRAQFCEALAEPLGRRDDRPTFFMLGLFSLLDALADRPIGEIVDEMSLSGEIRAALLGEGGVLGEALEVVRAFETGDWDSIEGFSLRARMAEASLPPLYREALLWSERILQAS